MKQPDATCFSVKSRRIEKEFQFILSEKPGELVRTSHKYTTNDALHIHIYSHEANVRYNRKITLIASKAVQIKNNAVALKSTLLTLKDPSRSLAFTSKSCDSRSLK
jgi:hypothetical protein